MIPKHVLQRLSLTALLAAAVACEQAGTPTSAVQAGDPGSRLLRTPSAIPGRYVVVFDRARVASSPEAARAIVGEHGGRLHHIYQRTIQGFAATLSREAVEALLNDPAVAYVAEDGMAWPSETQTPATWGLDRIDQRSPFPMSSEYTYTSTGAGVRAYVIDSGILTSHAEFQGRATAGVDFVGDGLNGEDCNGHGTHVAGTIGGATYGVAKAVSLVSVRVFACTGGAPYSTILSAVDWVTANAVKPAVVNMSLGGAFFQPINDAVTASIASGIPYAIAAGNADQDACGFSPASTPAALTVAASTNGDQRSGFSNWGGCVDLFAPGSSITSAWWTGTLDTKTISGTSMAAPHVAGVVALYLEGNPGATPAAVNSALLASASGGRISGTRGSPNLLVYSLLTPEALRLSPSDLNVSVLRTPGTSSLPAGAPGGVTFTASGAGGPRAGRVAPSGAAGALVSTAGGVTRSVTLTNTSAEPITWTSSSSAPWLSLSPASGTLNGTAAQELTVTLDADSLAEGLHGGTLTLTDGEATATLDVSLVVAAPAVLTSGVARTDLAGTMGSLRFFRISVPEGADSMRVFTGGGTGDADLYVRYGEVATLEEWDCRPYLNANVESCAAAAPAAGDYFITLHGWNDYSGVTLTAAVYAPTPPAAASDVQARGSGAGRVNVLWSDNSDNEERFRIRRALRNPDGSFGAYSIIGSRGPNSEVFLDSTVAIGSTYRYQVQTCNTVGCSYSTASSAISVVMPPPAPSLIQAVIAGIEKVNVSWADNAFNETTYRIRRAVRDSAGVFGPYATLRQIGANSVIDVDSSVEAGHTYRYQVQACNGGGCTSSSGVVVSIPPRPAAPHGMSGAVVSPTRIDLSWADGSSNETSFRLRRSTRNADGTWGTYLLIETLGSNTTTHQDSTVSPSGVYRYYVQACNAGGCTSSGLTQALTVPAAP